MKPFYDTFQLGVEVEAEIKRQPALETREAHITFQNDPSLRGTKEDGYCIEMISKLLKSEAMQKAYEDAIDSLEPVEIPGTTKKVFAYANSSAATHIHFSFKNIDNDMLWIFDTLDFERFFFTKYISTFKSKKFLNRINSRYCESPFLMSAQEGSKKEADKIRKDLAEINIGQFAAEKSRINERRYRWLNTYALDNDTGFELRIFPHVQTVKGLKVTIEFAKKVINEFFWKKETQMKLSLMKIYKERVENSEFKEDKLNDIKKLIYNALEVPESEEERRVMSGEIRLILARWVKQQPSLVEESLDQDIIF